MSKLILILAIATVATSADAYLGPGMGAGIIGVTLGILGSIVLALFAVIYYPIKRLLRRMKSDRHLERDEKHETE